MATITVTLDDKSVIDAFNRLQAVSRNMAPAMEAIAGILKNRTTGNFVEQRGPTGKWKPLKRPGKKRGANPQILSDTGHLRDSVVEQFGADFARIGTNVEYGPIHQFGGQISIAARSRSMFFKLHRDGTVGNRFVTQEKAGFEQLNARAYTINIPPRPFLPFIGDRLQDGVEAEILVTLRRFLQVA